MDLKSMGRLIVMTIIALNLWSLSGLPITTSRSLTLNQVKVPQLLKARKKMVVLLCTLSFRIKIIKNMSVVLRALSPATSTLFKRLLLSMLTTLQAWPWVDLAHLSYRVLQLRLSRSIRRIPKRQDSSTSTKKTPKWKVRLRKSGAL